MPTTNRTIILDTETTGMSAADGHRIIEIGCVEMIDRELTGNTYHQYLNPEREVDEGAYRVHGLSNDFLADKPIMAHCIDEFLDFIRGAELIIHNAAFDIGFLDYELTLLDYADRIDKICQVTDTLLMARRKFPGSRASLDALSKRYGITQFNRDLHGALLDAEILAQVYLAMTGGQTGLSFTPQQTTAKASGALSANSKAHMTKNVTKIGSLNLVEVPLSDEEIALHRQAFE